LKKATVWRILFCIILPVMTGACDLLELATDSCDQETFDSLRLPLPASVTNLDESCVLGFAPGNAQYNATFTMSPDDLQTFQDGTDITDWQTAASEASVLNEEAANLQSFIIGGYGDGIILQEVLIDTSNLHQYRVQVFNAFVD
jgi:hypothetical protein